MRVLLIAPYFDRTVSGESWSTYKWVEGICRECDATILTAHPEGWDPGDSPVEAGEIVNWNDLNLPKKMARLNWELKPGYVGFYRKARRWIKRELAGGRRWDLVHQINPLALRYPCPAAGLGLRHVMGPLAGSLPTPAGFAREGADRQWFRKLRGLDRIRLKIDPLMRRSYEGAEAILGVAPYVRELMSGLRIRRFEVMSETGVEAVAGTARARPAAGEPLRLLFVGRVIRTKGILDAIRALGRTRTGVPLQLDVLGAGDLLEECRKETARLGLDDIVHFHGRVARTEVDAYYRKSHVFLFPSFREPSGNVVIEALGHGLPVITCANGGPGHVVDETCGITVPAENPGQLAADLAIAIDRIAGLSSPDYLALSEGALARIRDVALWDTKISSLMSLYGELLGQAVTVPQPHRRPGVPPVSETLAK